MLNLNFFYEPQIIVRAVGQFCFKNRSSQGPDRDQVSECSLTGEKFGGLDSSSPTFTENPSSANQSVNPYKPRLQLVHLPHCCRFLIFWAMLLTLKMRRKKLSKISINRTQTWEESDRQNFQLNSFNDCKNAEESILHYYNSFKIWRTVHIFWGQGQDNKLLAVIVPLK